MFRLFGGPKKPATGTGSSDQIDTSSPPMRTGSATPSSPGYQQQHQYPQQPQQPLPQPPNQPIPAHFLAPQPPLRMPQSQSPGPLSPPVNSSFAGNLGPRAPSQTSQTSRMASPAYAPPAFVPPERRGSQTARMPTSPTPSQQQLPPPPRPPMPTGPNGPPQRPPVTQPQGPDTFLPIAALLHHFALLIGPFLPPTHLNAPPTQDEMLAATVAYLNSVKMPPQDISISRNPQQGFIVRVSFRGIKQLERAVEGKRVEKAVLVFQKRWRGVLARRFVNQLRAAKAKELEERAAKEVERPVRSRPRSGVPVSVPAPEAVAAANSWNTPDEKRLSASGKRLSADGKRLSTAEREERRRSKVIAFKSHLYKVSDSYEEIINSVKQGGDAPSEAEMEFMRLMNSDETFRLALNLRAMHKLEKPITLEEAQRNYEAQGGVPGRSPAQMYHDYSPRVVEWIVNVLNLQPQPSTDLVTLLRPADILCLLAIQMFPHVQCKLLNKGPEFTIHKAVFFLELCKTVGVKPGMLFSLKDLFLGGVDDDSTRKSGLTVLRTVCALERQARRRGWDGPLMVLKVERASQQQPPPAKIEETAAASVARSNAAFAAGSVAPAGTENAIGTEAAVLTLSSLTKRGSKIQGRPGVNGQRMSGGFYDPSNGGKRKSGTLSVRSSQESMRRSQLQSLQQQQQQYVTALPGNFKFLSRDDKVALLVALTPGEARESLRILYSAQNERFEYEDLMAVVWEKEHAETAKQEEHEKRVRAAIQVRESLGKRNEAIFSLLKDEESHLANLTALSEYLEKTLQYRLRLAKRRSRGLPTLIQLSPTKTIDIFAPRDSESSTATTLRVETETQEIARLDQVVRDLVVLHSGLVEDLKYLVEMQDSGVVGVLPAGDVFMQFSGEAGSLYVQFCTAALGEGSTVVDVVCGEEVWEGEDIKNVEGDEESLSISFVNSVVKRYIGERRVTLNNRADEVRWYLAGPLRRLQAYREIFEEIVAGNGVVEGGETRKGLSQVLKDDQDVGAEWRKLIKEDRKLEVTAIKLGSVASAISKRVVV